MLLSHIVNGAEDVRAKRLSMYAEPFQTQWDGKVPQIFELAVLMIPYEFTWLKAEGEEPEGGGYSEVYYIMSTVNSWYINTAYIV